MPYIKQDERYLLDAHLSAVTPTNTGDLNYCFTRLLDKYIQVNGVSYQTFNDIIGSLEGAKLELYRRLVVPYEDRKVKLNGDVYSISTLLEDSTK